MRIRIAHLLIWVANRFDKPTPPEKVAAALYVYSTDERDYCDPFRPNEW